ncbi:dihydrodipicolinate synthase family protein [Gracilibacillus sp. YIM 98692]|uniref:dihydrodipicolinate synthase family protein n=1 Tax=Gracilibacillus sp. YIM 98692 TaxID=2663532 RepID=UPI0013D5F2D7|nr:dihydrodipicolinate synthase family protein [Gracilibacillus sp. YIM 98692]
MKYLQGVTPAMVTPFDKDGSVNLKKLVDLTEFLISKGVHCLYPLGTTGEMLKLTVEERKAVAETVVKTANGRVTVNIHVGDTVQKNVIELAHHALKIGADGIGIVTPIYFSVNDQEMENFYVEIASSLPDDFPVYLYNIPQCASNDLSSQVAQRIADRCKNVVGIKYSYPDILKTSKYLNINNENFKVVFGAEQLLLPAFALGCDGTVSGVSGVFPEPFVALYNACQENDLEKARHFQKIITHYCEILKNGSIPHFKEALRLRGVDVGYMRRPQLDITNEESAALKEELKQIKF